MVDSQALHVENALLRGSLWLTTNSLKAYREAPHSEIDREGVPTVVVIVTDAVRAKAAEAITRADKLLHGPQQVER